MNKYDDDKLNLLDTYRQNRSKIKDIPSLTAFLLKDCKGFSFSFSYTGNENSPVGFVNGFVHPPEGYSGVRPLYLQGRSEQDYVDRVKAALPRILNEIVLIEEERAAVVMGVEEAQGRAVDKVARTPRGTASKAGRAQPVKKLGDGGKVVQGVRA